MDELLLTADFIERIRAGIDLKVEVGQCDQEPPKNRPGLNLELGLRLGLRQEYTHEYN